MKSSNLTYSDDNTSGIIYNDEDTVGQWTFDPLTSGWKPNFNKLQAGVSYPVGSICLSAAGPWYPGPIVPEKKKCNFCKTETHDFRLLKIGRMTDVVVCDMCMLKALSKTLSEDSNDGDGGGDPGDDQHSSGEESCGHGSEEEEKG